MQNRRKFLTQTSFAAGALTLLKPLQSIAGSNTGAPTDNTITILYTSGLAEQWQKVNGIGGLDAIKDAASQVKRNHRNTLLLDAGNILSAHSKRSISHLHYFRALKKAGFDVITPGRNDMQHGADYFSRLVEESRLKTVATNYYKQGYLNETVLPFYIVRKGNIKIGIIGIGSNQTVEMEKASASNLITWVNETAASLRQKHKCTIVICLSHLSLRSETGLDNMRLAEATEFVDLVISDNDNRFAYNTYSLKNKSAHDVLLTHAGNQGSMMGQIDITVNNSGEKINITARQLFTGAAANDAQAAFRKHASALV